MENYDNINDKDLNRLLKQRLLEQEDDALLDAEAKLVFSSTVVIAPDIKKEKAFLKKFNKTKGGFWQWLIPVTGTLIGLAAFLYFYQHIDRSITNKTAHEIQSLTSNTTRLNVQAADTSNSEEKTHAKQLPETSVLDHTTKTIKEKNDTINTFLKKQYLGIYSGQLIDHLLKENESCSYPVIIRDSSILLLNTPTGPGGEFEVPGTIPDEKLYFEKEHNRIWYKFSIKENCKLAFDIAPINKTDNFDFMLFQYNGPAFDLKMQKKQIIPIRSCISANDKTMNGKTGLCYNEHAPAFVHSESGPSYVKYVNAQKGQVFYLVVAGAGANNNNPGSGAGYTIHFNYKGYDPNVLYVGKSIFNRIYFVTDQDVFRSNSGYSSAIDSIYALLKAHPKIKVEIQGHVNSIELQKENGQKTHSQLLSEKRARAVFNCLVEDGIDSLRLVTAGYAGTRKKIQDPQTIAERSKNVRVEIVILSLDYEADLKAAGHRIK